VARFTRELPDRDADGNSEMVIPTTGGRSLHAYRDGTLPSSLRDTSAGMGRRGEAAKSALCSPYSPDNF
jgi:hypothetical protein